jgi:predicted secreted Zn-dependent protease
MRNNGFALALVAGCFALGLGPWSAVAQSTVVRKTNYYAMTGSSLRDIQESLRQTRPWKDKSGRDASTEWYVRWYAEYSSGGGTCHCSSFTTTTTITITLPRWIAPTNTPAEVRTAWAKYVAALEVHEIGHADLALAAAAEMHKRIKEIGSDSDCNALRTRVQNECQAALDSYRAQEKDYDRRTRHGATQGATFRRPREQTQ